MNEKRRFYEIELFNNIKPNSDKSIVWGNFEYISFRNAGQFDVLSENPQIIIRNTIIPNSRVYIYECSTTKDLYFSGNNEDDGLFLSNKSQYRFIGVSLFNFHEKIITEYLPKVVENNDEELAMTKICNKLKKELYKIVECEDLVFDVFGALDSYDVCVISLFNDIGKHIKFIEEIQNVKINEDLNLFESSYSVLTSPYLDDTENVVFKDNSGYANIQITYNSCASFEGLVSYVLHELDLCSTSENNGDKLSLNGVDVFSTLGEFDIVIQLPIKMLNNKLYCKMLNPDEPFYQGHIQQCNTRFSLKKDNLMYDSKYIEGYELESRNLNHDISSVIIEAERKYTNLTKTDLYLSNPCMREIYDMLWNDYQRAVMMSIRNPIWKEDLTTQFISIIDFANSFFEGKNKSHAFKFSAILADIFKESIYHLHQSNSPDLNAIQSLFKSAGTYDKIINCYYFIVKNILRMVYLCGNPQQSELIPFINFKAVPIISSELISCTDLKDFKILSIDLPYDTFYNIDNYIPFLYHEIGHYVCPQNRMQRNYYFYLIILVELIKQYISQNFTIVDLDSITEVAYQLVMKHTKPDVLNLCGEAFSQVWHDFYDILKQSVNSIWGLIPDDFEEPYDWCVDLKIQTENILSNIEKELLSTMKEKKINLDSKQNLSASLNYWNEVDSVVYGLREVMADTFMIENTFMTLEEYLSLYIYSCAQQAWQCEFDDLAAMIRIGTIIQYYICDDNPKKTNSLESFKLPEEIKLETQRLCKKIIPNCDITKVNEVYLKLMDDYKNYQRAWNVLIELFIQIKNSVVFEVDGNQIENNRSLVLFYNIMQQYNLSEQLDSPKYLKYIDLSYYQPNLQEMNHEKKERKILDESENTSLFKQEQRSRLSLSCTTIPTYCLNHAQDFNLAIRLLAKKIGNDYDVFWYRGQTQEWPLNPNLFRKVKTKRLPYLRDLYNEFVAQSADSPELVGAIRTEADWLSYMQHYDVPTNFLDWSEQALSALYFALENYFVPPCKHNPNDTILSECANDDLKRRVDYTKDSVVWILNPVRMNRVIYGDNLNMSIPNLSIKNTITDTNTERFLINENKQSSSAEDYPRYAPMAISTAKISNRIRTQKGHFVAFDVSISDVINGKYRKVKCYKGKKEPMINLKNKIIKIMPKKSLEDLVRYHEWLFSNNHHRKEYHPFLAKLIIPFSIKEELVDYLKHMGISLSSIYPELTNIGKDVTKRCNNIHIKDHS